MAAIEKIIIPCRGKDAWMARICVASIRYWYPDIPICLLKDVSGGSFYTTDLETYWNVTVWPQDERKMYIYSKLNAYFSDKRERALLLDADTIFMGPLLSVLEAHAEDFVVNWNGDNQPLSLAEREKLASDNFHDVDVLKTHFPDYELPNVFFNAGHLVLTTGVLTWADFSPYLTSTSPPVHKFPGAFLCYDQGLLNYLLTKQSREGRFTLAHTAFVQWHHHVEEMKALDIQKLERREGYPFLIHWAGRKSFYKTSFLRSDLLRFYEDFYYSKIPNGNWRRRVHLARRMRKEFARITLVARMKKLQPDFRKLVQIDESPQKEPQIEAYLSPV